MTPRLAFVGCGSHSTTNLYPALAYVDCRLDAVCDQVIALAERNARLFGAAAVYTDLERMLDERRPDGVIIVGPPELHDQAARCALTRGIPVYVEKPTAPSLVQAQELVALARQHGTSIMTGYMKRFGTPYAHLRRLIQAGSFTPTMGTFRYGHWRCDDLRNMLLFMSVHMIDLAIFLFGAPVSVSSALVHPANRGFSLSVVLRFASGCVVQLALDSSQPRIQERIEISGVIDGGNALAVVDNVQHLEIHRQGCNGIDLTAASLPSIEPRFELDDIRLWRPDYGIPNLGQERLFFQGFIGALREFAASISQRRDPSPSPEEALQAMRVIEALIACPDGTTALLQDEAVGSPA